MNAIAPSAALEILKPITWFPPMWAFMCGVVSSGAPLPRAAGCSSLAA
jgi:chlorophyll/bacteriochlorophyll a synthase